MLYAVTFSSDGRLLATGDKVGHVAIWNVENGEKLGEVSSEALNRIWDQLSVALAHEMIGGARNLLESTVEYTKVRFQFGRPIGSFQALKHRCADLLMEFELARAQVETSPPALIPKNDWPTVPATPNDNGSCSTQ